MKNNNHSKLLEILKLVITNIFFIKFANVTMISICIYIYVKAAKDISEYNLICKLIIAFLPLFLWVIDSYYRYKKRIFSELFNTKKLVTSEGDENKIKIYKIKKFVISFFSIMNLIVYLPMSVLAIICSGFFYESRDLPVLSFCLIIIIFSFFT